MTTNKADMKKFYAALNAETSVISLNNDSTVVSEFTNKILSEETKKALKTVHDFLVKDFSVMLSDHEYNTMVDNINYLTSLSAEDGVSVETKSLIIQVSRQLTYWYKDYTYEGRKIESSTAKILRFEELEECLEANKIIFKEKFDLENELCNELIHLELQKKELEKQIEAIGDNMYISHSAWEVAKEKTRKLFEEAKILKIERDELREQVPHLRYEWVLAKYVQANIKDEWSKLGKKFNKRTRHMEFDNSTRHMKFD